jgi:type IV secretory pathway VirB2 component (pilin)
MKFQRIAVFIGLVAMLTIPELAFAAGPGETTSQNILTWLTGTLARTCATIAVVSVGYGCFKGRIDWERGIAVITGIVIIFGGATIVNMAQSA